ncbi:hypothetical protein FLONG3_7286 [Fusarium longipes]|uniref:Uncharacterized protein n=1 Tax=Fusarium longipes TaxID=694270 RepID=A0A395SEK9_9HYPO|nr:hypothetical protein FLONG3_7286 [Fusarium longipes]
MTSQFLHLDRVSSQYGDDVYRAYFQAGEPSWVHIKVLQPHERLMQRVSDDPDATWSKCVNLKDLDYCVGHAIIHFLYTDTYQSLKVLDLPEGVEEKYTLSEGLRVCIAADSLQLPLLRRLAVKKAKQASNKLSLRDVFNVIEDLKFQPNQILAYKEYLYNRMGTSQFCAPGQTTHDLLLDLSSENTLSMLTLRTMILQHQRKVEAVDEKSITTRYQDLVMELEHKISTMSEMCSILNRTSEESISPMVKRLGRGERFEQIDRLRMTNFCNAIAKLANSFSSEKTTLYQEQRAQKWLHRTPMSSPLPDTRSQEDGASVWSESLVAMTPSSSGSFWDGEGSGHTE